MEQVGLESMEYEVHLEVRIGGRRGGGNSEVKESVDGVAEYAECYAVEVAHSLDWCGGYKPSTGI